MRLIWSYNRAWARCGSSTLIARRKEPENDWSAWLSNSYRPVSSFWISAACAENRAYQEIGKTNLSSGFRLQSNQVSKYCKSSVVWLSVLTLVFVRKRWGCRLAWVVTNYFYKTDGFSERYLWFRSVIFITGVLDDAYLDSTTEFHSWACL